MTTCFDMLTLLFMLSEMADCLDYNNLFDFLPGTDRLAIRSIDGREDMSHRELKQLVINCNLAKVPGFTFPPRWVYFVDFFT